MWTDDKNERRCDLIDKEVNGNITDEEKVELEQLQEEMSAYRQQVAPLPINKLRKIYGELIAKKPQTTGINMHFKKENDIWHVHGKSGEIAKFDNTGTIVSVVGDNYPLSTLEMLAVGLRMIQTHHPDTDHPSFSIEYNRVKAINELVARVEQKDLPGLAAYAEGLIDGGF